MFGYRDVIALASERWRAGHESPEPRAYQPMLLRIMTGASDTSVAAERGPHSESIDRAFQAVMRCDQRAGSTLASNPAIDPERERAVMSHGSEPA